MNDKEFLELAKIIMNKKLTMKEMFKRMREIAPQHEQLISELESSYLRKRKGEYL